MDEIQNIYFVVQSVIVSLSFRNDFMMNQTKNNEKNTLRIVFILERLWLMIVQLFALQTYNHLSHQKLCWVIEEVEERSLKGDIFSGISPPF